MKVYEALARAFVEEGVRGVFTMMGDANMYWLNAVNRLGVRIYDVRHEGAGLAMADGWGRVTGEPGIVSTTGGPGTTQLATTLIVAARARTPLIAFCGDSATNDDSDAQRFDPAPFAASLESAFVRLERAEDAYDAVALAFAIARDESRPVMLSVPQDVQQEAFDPELPFRPAERSRTAAAASDADIEVAAELLVQSKRPVILVGRGAVGADAGEAVLTLAERSGALLATTLHAKNWLGEAPFHLRIAGGYGTRTARGLLRSADLVVAIGASVSPYTTDGGELFEDAQIIQIDRQPAGPLGDGRIPDLHVQADARLAVEQLVGALAARGHTAVGLRTPEVAEALGHAFDDDDTVELEPGTLDPRAACRALDEAIPSDVGLVLGSGQQIRFPTMLMLRQRSFVVAQHHFGCIGQGVTTALGAIAATGRPAFTLEGDAGFMMHLAELETAVRYELPLLVVVMNDEAVGAELHKSRAVGLDERLAMIRTPDLGAVARSLGAAGSLATTVEELTRATEEWVDDPRPALIDARISRNVLSIPYRRAFYGEDV
jgi:thiamine pyrophosphate-dependent acetolactate synthase large subunit-like protein